MEVCGVGVVCDGRKVRSMSECVCVCKKVSEEVRFLCRLSGNLVGWEGARAKRARVGVVHGHMGAMFKWLAG